MLYYSDDARQRIVQLGSDALDDFTDGIPHSWLEQSVLRHLPSIPGFRSGSPTAMREQKKRLLQRLMTPESHKATLRADWRSFLTIWLLWTEHNIDSKDVMSELRKAYESKADTELSLVGERVESFCWQLANSRQVSKRSLEAFANYSPFDPAIFSRCIDAALDDDALKSARLLDSLPERLASVDSTATELRETLNALSEQIDALRVRCDESMPRSEVVACIADINRQIADISAHLRRFGDSQELIAQQSREMSSGRVDDAKRLMDLHAAILALQKSDVEHRSSIEALEERFSVVEKRDAASMTGMVPPDRSDDNGAKNGAFVLQAHGATEVAGAESLDRPGDLLPQLYRNLNGLGLSKAFARSVASELVAAILTGQLVLFSGSLGELFANVLINSLCAKQCLEGTVPIGFSEAHFFSRLLSGPTTTPNSICLHSINFSSFELYGALLRSTIVSRQFDSCAPLPIIIGTLASGPLVIRTSGSVHELGLTIDTDSLVWRSAPAKALKYGQLELSAVQASAPPTVSSELFDEVDAVIKQLPIKTSEVFTRSWKRALEQLCALVDSEFDESLAIDSLVSSWVVPYATSAGVPVSMISKACLKLSESTGDKGGRLSIVLANMAMPTLS